jgi:hypothetical protein
MTPMAYYANFWNMPTLKSEYYWKDGSPVGLLNSVDTFNRNGSRVYMKRPNLNVTSALDHVYLLNQDYTLDESKFQANYPFYLTEMLTFSYFCSLAQITAIFSHVYIWYGSEIFDHANSALNDSKVGLRDMHNKLSSKTI